MHGTHLTTALYSPSRGVLLTGRNHHAIGLAAIDYREALRTVLQRYAPTWLMHLPALLGDGERERLQRQLPDVMPGSW